MLKDTKSLGNNKAPACESRGFVHKKEVCILTHLLDIRQNSALHLRHELQSKREFSLNIAMKQIRYLHFFTGNIFNRIKI